MRIQSWKQLLLAPCQGIPCEATDPKLTEALRALRVSLSWAEALTVGKVNFDSSSFSRRWNKGLSSCEPPGPRHLQRAQKKEFYGLAEAPISSKDGRAVNLELQERMSPLGFVVYLHICTHALWPTFSEALSVAEQSAATVIVMGTCNAKILALCSCPAKHTPEPCPGEHATAEVSTCCWDDGWDVLNSSAFFA